MKYGGVTRSLELKNVTEYLPPVLISDRKIISDGGRVKYAYEYYMKYLDSKVFRTYYQKEELPIHNRLTSHNAPRRKFQVMSFKEFDNEGFDINHRQSSDGMYSNEWQQLYKASNADPSDDACPPGWRIPNQKEFVLIIATKPNVKNNNLQTHDGYDWWINPSFYDRYGCASYTNTSAEGDDAIVEDIINKREPTQVIQFHTTQSDYITTNPNANPGSENKTYLGITSNAKYEVTRILPVRDVE